MQRIHEASKENITLEWQTHARYTKGRKPNATRYHPEKLSALTSRSIYQKSRPTKIGPESTGVRLQHLESTRNVVIHRSRLESTSSSSGDCRSPALPVDGVWSPPATPRGRPHPKRCGCPTSSGHDNVGPSSDVWPISYHEMVRSHVVSAFRNLRPARRQPCPRRVASALHTMHQGLHV